MNNCHLTSPSEGTDRPNSGFYRFLLFSAVFLHVISSLQAAEPTPSGLLPQDIKLLTAKGQVEISVDGGKQWTPGEADRILNIGNRVRTGRRSRASIQMSDKSVLRVRQLSTIIIQAPAANSGDKPVLDLQSGSSYFFSRESPTEVQFRTPLTSGAIRGTEFEITVAGNGETDVTMLDGEVLLSNDLGQELIVSGERGTVLPGQKPVKSPAIDALNTIQWALYYPGFLHTPDLELTPAEQTTLQPSLNAYARGNLEQSLALLPDKLPASDTIQLYSAIVELSVGNVAAAQSISTATIGTNPGIRAALATLLKAIGTPNAATSLGTPTTATHWLAESYLRQARHRLADAKAAVQAALQLAPDFGYAWVRLAEFEFGEGNTQGAKNALANADRLNPENAQLHAVRGFVLLANKEAAAADASFTEAIRLDGALGNAWLGRALVQIKQGNYEAGRRALQTAAILEPQRAIYRSYLGKAYSAEHLNELALRDLDRAKDLDPNDPTAWLYSALVKKEVNRINEAVSDLQSSQELNDNRGLFRSRYLLDEDQAIRSANLASVYRDAGMLDLSRREASRAVDYDITNPAAHLFLASSYDTLRDPKQLNLRYETPWASELFLANLLMPVGAAPLSQNISQHEYSRLFDRSGYGLSSNTDYFSNGDWQQTSSHYGRFDKFSYSLDVDYRLENGQRPNNDFERMAVWAKTKFQLSDRDSLLIQTVYSDYESGDVAQYFDQSSASTTQRVTEVQEPLLFVGYHREWHPGSHTLFLASRFDDTLTRTDPAAVVATLNQNAAGTVTGITPLVFDLDYRRELTGYSGELQHLLKTGDHSFVVGTRYQWADVDTSATLFRSPIAFPPIFATPPVDQNLDQSLDRFSAYAYYGWDILSNLQLWGGISYDHLDYPINSEIPPLSDAQANESQVSPKVGFRWDPYTNTTLRGIYSQSLGGVFFDNSIRLEPTQLGGFNHAFRSIIPESVTGLVPGSSFETFGLAWDQRFKSNTYLNVTGELLRSDGSRDQGVFEFSSLPAVPGGSREYLDYEERSLQVTLDQLVAKRIGLGTTYRVSQADLNQSFPDIPTSVLATANQDLESTLHQIRFYARYNHESGLYSQLEALWSKQTNRGYTPQIGGDDFWQFNTLVGYRFYQRRAQVQVGVLNITNQDYQLNPLTLYQEMPRERMFVANFRFNF